MRKENVLKNNYEFNRIIENQAYRKNRYFVVYFVPNFLNHARFGISVGKKIGKAVVRNRLKRQVRSIVDENKKYYSNGFDYIIMVRKGCLSISYQEMKMQLYQLLNQIELKEKTYEKK